MDEEQIPSDPTEPSDRGVYAKSIHSGKWYMASVVAQKSLTLVTFFILARLLVPGDYGVMAIVTLVLALMSQVTDFSFGDAFIQKKGDIEPYLDPMWTYEVLRAFVIGAVLLWTAPAIAAFFNIQPQFLILLRVSGLLLIVPAFSNIRQIYLYKELHFYSLFVRDVVTQIAFSLAAIGFAVLVQASVWALFVGYMAKYVTGIVVSYALYPSRPSFSLKFMRLKELVSYTKWVYGQNLLDFFFAQVDKLFVGHLLSSSELGLYAKAKDTASIATTTLASMITTVGLPAFSKVQDRLEKVQEGFLKSIDVLLIICLPVTLLLLFEGGGAVRLLLGVKWLGLVVPLKIFAFGNLFIAFVRVVSPVLGAVGRPDINFKMNFLQAGLSVPLLYFGYRYFGVNGLAYGVVVAWIALLLYVVVRARPILKIPKQFFLPAFLSGGAAGLGVLAVDVGMRALTGETTALPWILARLSLLGIVYFVLLFGVSQKIARGPWMTLQSILRELGVLKRSV